MRICFSAATQSLAISLFCGVLITGCGTSDPAKVGETSRAYSASSEGQAGAIRLRAPSAEQRLREGQIGPALDTESDAARDSEADDTEADKDQHDQIVENPFKMVWDHPLSTFSIDVDTASYSKVRQHLLSYGRLPRPDAVRIEELLNYFSYDYAPPAHGDTEPFATHIAVAQAPWNPKHRLARVALKGRVMENQHRPPSNLVFLIDTSGSMKQPNKLPLLKRSLSLLLQQLGSKDRVAIVAYAGAAGVILESTPATQSTEILNAFGKLAARGSTNGSQGLKMAYQVARSHMIDGGTNRVLICTDGDFNVGQTSDDELISMIQDESKSGIDLTVLGFGMGNLNDAMLEQISGQGNGNYAFIDTYNEARKVLQEQIAGTLVTIAKDIKIQVEFNPAKVAAYRLIGYENRLLATEDFNDDKKDAGEIGAGHSVTALYEIIPTGTEIQPEIASVDQLKYQKAPSQSDAAQTDELLTLKLRYKLPEHSESQLVQHVVTDSGAAFDQSDQEFQFAAAVAGFGMLLRESPHSGDWSYDSVSEIAESALGVDKHGFRKEFLEMVTAASMLAAK
ncbi:vWA domain-containing protein [Planctomycetes bacterium K23_9]|uniref:von Willebrand factor n=1 Tax=Stieleria marina TaxID=1930275 RepID=A0A517NYC3_9BACT|nr:von Willebrand factor [Planctomycetes bacterium K23_9]